MILGKDKDKTWVTLSGYPDESYFISPLTAGAMERYTLKNSVDKILVNYPGYLLDCLEDFLHDWKGLITPNSKEAICNKKNKSMLIETSPNRITLLIDRATYPVTFTDEPEERLKKLGASSNGANGRTEAKKIAEPV